MYYQPPPKEPSGCMQTITITRVVIGILLVPMALIMGSIFFILIAFYALTVHPLLALLVLLAGGAIIVIAGKWESHRVAKENPRDDE